MNDRPVVILTALNLEYEAVRETLSDLRVHRHTAGTRFEIGQLAGGRCRVVLGLVGKGNHPAAVLAERAIAAFRPKAVLFVGVAGGLRPSIALGDVVVATHVYAYHGGTSQDDGLKARPRVWEIAHGPDQIARHLDRTRTWQRRLPADAVPPRVHFGPIAAGEVVQDSSISEQARWVRQHYNDALAIEMEAAGVAQAAHLNNALPVVVVRGVSDRADGTKAATDGIRWQPRAVANAVAFATALAEELTYDTDTDQPGTKGSTAMHGDSVSNIATGNARVGFQAGHIYGTVQMGGADRQQPTDLATEIAALRGHLKEARLVGSIDEATYTAAEVELDAATRSMEEGAPGRSGLMIALKRLRGLVDDVTELAARLAAVIALARELS
ncbi:5'-methylthioadenosine/S-adenosylhomocysteine nucleosidase [Micromonospora sp. NPDC023956]|uniref:5'-methylthioadenosine/S-adenosylhomocysteine nucleosidase family protein n=1 Tax=Micromonospora sp. NPDC023956 TaxID=3155722 RepID=UPI0033FB9A30